MIIGSTSARVESCRVADTKRKAARVHDQATLNQAMVCIHCERRLEEVLDELPALSELVFQLHQLAVGDKPIPRNGLTDHMKGPG